MSEIVCSTICVVSQRILSKKPIKVGVIIIPRLEVKKPILREQRSLPNIFELASDSGLGYRLNGPPAPVHRPRRLASPASGTASPGTLRPAQHSLRLFSIKSPFKDTSHHICPLP